MFAVHIADGVLTWPWIAGGFVVAGVVVIISSWRIRNEEISRVALMTAAFFVASLLHVKLGPTTVHLLFNGLMGITLGRRVALGIPVGLWMQNVLIGHGGLTTIGINACVQILPALAAWRLFALFRDVHWAEQPRLRSAIVGLSVLSWCACLVYAGGLLLGNPSLEGKLSWLTSFLSWTSLYPLGDTPASIDWALCLLSNLAIWLAIVLLAAFLVRLERRLENAPEFPIGLLLGQLTVLLTVFLNCLVLAWGGADDWRTLAQFTFLAHLPVAAIEGVVLGFTIGFLARVKPEMIGG